MINKNKNIDILRYHKLALAPFVEPVDSSLFESIRRELQEPENPFWDFISLHSLAPIWHSVLKQNATDLFISPQITEMLRGRALRSAANYLLQRQALNTIKHAFATSNMPYAVFKGAHIREQLYAQQAVRPSCDIDVLISKADKVRAIRLLSENGYAIQPKAKDISHEVTMASKTVSVDLHWEILRPGRTRIDLTDELLNNSVDYTAYRGLNNEATLFIMLVHPVFAKYTSSNLASLIRMVDLIKWLQIQTIDFKKVYSLLDRAGVKTAAWITCTWLTLLTGTELSDSFIQAVQPSKIKRIYMQTWLQKNLATSLSEYPFFIKTGFTLPAHDTFRDACRAGVRLYKEKKYANENLKNLLQALEKP